MFKYLVRRVQDKTYCIDARDILFLVQKRVNAAPTNAPGGAGSLTSPWRLSTAAQWLGCSKSLPKGTENYLIAAGRLIKRGSNQYISDEGPAWRAGHTAWRAGDAGALPVTAPGPETGPAPAALKAFRGKAPTYREAAEQIVDPNQILPEANARRRAAGLAGAATWASIRKQPMLCRTIRAILKGEKLDLFVGGKFVKDYSRMQTALPVLTVAMFLAEPARNSRAFPVNLMLLDLAEGGTGGYTLDRILWHPDGLHVKQMEEYLDFWDPLSGTDIGPVSKTNRTLRPITQRADLHLVGGIMPASPTGGGELGKKTLPDSKPGKPKPKFTADYIHDKEAAVVVKWLEWATFSAWQAVIDVPRDQLVEVSYQAVVFPERPINKFAAIQTDLKRFDTLIASRCQRLDPGRLLGSAVAASS